MKNFLLRFPHLGQGIFEILDDENIVKCKEVSKSWSFFMDGERFFWKKIIKKLIKNYDDFEINDSDTVESDLIVDLKQEVNDAWK